MRGEQLPCAAGRPQGSGLRRGLSDRMREDLAAYKERPVIGCPVVPTVPVRERNRAAGSRSDTCQSRSSHSAGDRQSETLQVCHLLVRQTCWPRSRHVPAPKLVVSPALGDAHPVEVQPRTSVEQIVEPPCPAAMRRHRVEHCLQRHEHRVEALPRPLGHSAVAALQP